VCVCVCAGFIAYIAVVSVGAVWLVFYASRRWGNTNPLVYITITGTIGSLSVMGCKGLGVGIKQTVAGTSQLTNPAMWMILVTVATCITVQVCSSSIRHLVLVQIDFVYSCRAINFLNRVNHAITYFNCTLLR